MAVRRPGCGTRASLASVIGVVLVSLPIITHGNVGITQFGYRFSLDFQVLLFVILATVFERGMSRLAMVAAASRRSCSARTRSGPSASTSSRSDAAGAAMADVLRLTARPPRAAPGAWRFLPLLIALCAVAALVAARLPAPPGEVLWNLDLPKIDAPLAVFFHEALGRGQLPLWQERLGLGFPLYAEGQIGAFYPPNWLIYQFEPLVALDVNRVVHLAAAGVGDGAAGAPPAAVRGPGRSIAAAVAILGGGDRDQARVEQPRRRVRLAALDPAAARSPARADPDRARAGRGLAGASRRWPGTPTRGC